MPVLSHPPTPTGVVPLEEEEQQQDAFAWSNNPDPFGAGTAAVALAPDPGYSFGILLDETSSCCSSVIRSVCYNSTIDSVADSGRKRKRRSGKDDGYFDDDERLQERRRSFMEDRRQGYQKIFSRLDSEQSRRDELSDSCRRLKDALPVPNTIPNTLLIDFATTHIKSLEMRVQQAEDEAARLRQCVHFSSHSFPVLTLFS